MGMNDRSLDLRWTLFAVVIFCITLTVGAGTALGEDGFTPQRWQVSRSYPADRVDLRQYPHFFSIFQAGWEDIEAKPDGRLPLADLRPRQFDGGDCVLIRTTCVCDAPVTAAARLLTDDDLVVFVNGQRQTIEPARKDGSLALQLPLRRGLNELMLAVTTTDDALTLTCRSDRAMCPPAKAHHRMTKLWETEAVFNIPESALYDAERDVIYISSFARVQTRETHQGFISRLSTGRRDPRPSVGHRSGRALRDGLARRSALRRGVQRHTSSRSTPRRPRSRRGTPWRARRSSMT
jgi:hypothetical protein